MGYLSKLEPSRNAGDRRIMRPTTDEDNTVAARHNEMPLSRESVRLDVKSTFSLTNVVRSRIIIHYVTWLLKGFYLDITSRDCRCGRW